MFKNTMKFVAALVIFCTFFACVRKDRPDVRRLVRQTKIVRLDKKIFALDTLKPDLGDIYSQHGHFMDTYTRGVLNLGVMADSGFTGIFSYFIKDPVMREVADSVALTYPDTRIQEKQLAWAWAYYSYYFPDKVIPGMYAYISGFNQSVIVDSAAVGVSLDNYLGEHCIFYRLLAIPVPQYARKKMIPENIPRDMVLGWVTAEFPFRPQTNDLVSGMIYQGKLSYLLKNLFPDQPETWILGFTPEQEEWCYANESRIWGFLIENEYLFSQQQRLIMKYLNDAPFTSGMPVESPGKTVVWTGLRIVEKYISKTGIPLQELMEEQDYHKILRVAAYRP